MRSGRVRGSGRSLLHGVHTHERVALAYFSYLAALGFFYPLSAVQRLVLFSIPVAIYFLLRWEAAESRPWSKVARQWASLALILLAYWSLAWFVSAPLKDWQAAWVRWDDQLLNAYGLRSGIEAAGPLGPRILETCYLLVYAIPPLSLGALYLCRASARVNRYLLIVLLGTFAVYALVPFFPVEPPWLAFPASSPAQSAGVVRTMNAFLLSRFDVAIAVFPSGHVAVALSSALGLFEALRERAWIWGSALLLAGAIYIATIYGRYHYAVDGLASVFVVLPLWSISRQWRTHED